MKLNLIVIIVLGLITCNKHEGVIVNNKGNNIAFKGQVTIQRRMDISLTDKDQFIVDYVYLQNDSIYLATSFGGSGEYLFKMVAISTDSLKNSEYNLYPLVHPNSIDDPSLDFSVFSIFDISQLKKLCKEECDTIKLNVYKSDWKNVATQLKVINK